MRFTRAFTLAEVLITLAVIGIVAALTIPNMIHNYKKRLLEIRIQRFSSIWQQADKLRNIEHDYGSLEKVETIPARNPDAMLELFNKYWRPHIKINKVEKLTKGIIMAFPDGSGAYLAKNYSGLDIGNDVTNNMYLIFCVDYKSCKSINENKGTEVSQFSDGRNTFEFWTDGRPPKDHSHTMTRDDFIEKCKTTQYWCSTLIEQDGWKIKDDYPIKF